MLIPCTDNLAYFIVGFFAHPIRVQIPLVSILYIAELEMADIVLAFLLP